MSEPEPPKPNNPNLEQTTERVQDLHELTTSPVVLHQWTQYAAWTGPLPVIYRSFDTLDDLILMKRDTEESFNVLVSGQVRRKKLLK